RNAPRPSPAAPPGEHARRRRADPLERGRPAREELPGGRRPARRRERDRAARVRRARPRAVRARALRAGWGGGGGQAAGGPVDAGKGDQGAGQRAAAVYGPRGSVGRGGDGDPGALHGGSQGTRPAARRTAREAFAAAQRIVHRNRRRPPVACARAPGRRGRARRLRAALQLAHPIQPLDARARVHVAGRALPPVQLRRGLPGLGRGAEAAPRRGRGRAGVGVRGGV
ncbi:hypothetical protein GLOTRDRAFT_112688, partial [Gloeophyllum trabeum ATCC 11539]